MTHHEHEEPFYGKWILRDREQDYIRNILRKYRHDEVNEELKQKVYDELMMEKHLGHISIPFRVVVRRDAYGKYPPHIEVMLDSKV